MFTLDCKHLHDIHLLLQVCHKHHGQDLQKQTTEVKPYRSILINCSLGMHLCRTSQYFQCITILKSELIFMVDCVYINCVCLYKRNLACNNNYYTLTETNEF